MERSVPFRPAHRRRFRPLRRLLLRRERARIASCINELRGLVDIPHEIGEVAAARIARLARRLRAVERLLRSVPAWHFIAPLAGAPRAA
jgi:hypothetical protein